MPPMMPPPILHAIERPCNRAAIAIADDNSMNAKLLRDMLPQHATWQTFPFSDRCRQQERQCQETAEELYALCRYC